MKKGPFTCAIQENNVDTIGLLQRWHEGDREALDEILVRDLSWIHKQVHFKLGDRIRSKEETVDIVQDAVIDFLQYGPRFLISDKDQFRGLVAQIVANTIRDKNDWYKAKRRALDREKPLPSDTVINLDAAGRKADGPKTLAQKNEREALIRLALELIDPDDRQVIVLRQLEDRSFPEIGEQLGIDANTVRMRFNRAMPRLAKRLDELRSGTLP